MDSAISSLPPQVRDMIWDNLYVAELIAIFSIAAAGSLEVVMSIFDNFQRYRGVYFWSMQIAAWGILVHAIMAELRYLSIASEIAMALPFVIVVNDIRRIRWVLWMIIANFFILHMPMTGLFICLNLGDNRCVRPARIFDRIQVTVFGLQDTLICAIYIAEAVRALKPIYQVKGRQGRKVIYWLLFVNGLGILLDILIIVSEFRAHNLAIGFKSLAYSVKLKLEFYALTQLRELTRTYPCSLCQGIEGNTARGASSDINIFDMIANPAQPATVETGTLPSFVGTISPPPPNSTRSSAYDFHEALRETMSTENSIHLHTDTTSPIRSETRSTVEMTLLETPK
ncbi:unnamed protein product [Penicillium bialowiezense]